MQRALTTLPLSSPGSTGRSSTPCRFSFTSTPVVTGCPAFAGHDTE